MNALIFPLRVVISMKSVLALKSATSSRFFDKKTEMGRKGKLARGQAKAIPSWKAGCPGARNAQIKTLTGEGERKHIA